MQTTGDFFWNVLERGAKLIGIIVSLATLLGAMIIFIYLQNLHQIGIFTNVISMPSTLLSLIVIFTVIIVLVFGIPFYLPYGICKNIQRYTSKKGGMITFGIFHALPIPLLYVLDRFSVDINEKIFFSVYAFILFFPIAIFIWIIYDNNKHKWNEKIFDVIIIFGAVLDN
ncbi:hypothetical protein [Neisseria perflava]|uniref:hypothetical protein n=1 Tax=Neisseria perflava TaxID=33053 RepID=UPI00209E1900|nr:hypothetical protein [Neisseria perflava]MCP1661192.1 hypothetical protein [Neisseria perflava]